MLCRTCGGEGSPVRSTPTSVSVKHVVLTRSHAACFHWLSFCSTSSTGLCTSSCPIRRPARATNGTTLELGQRRRDKKLRSRGQGLMRLSILKRRVMRPENACSRSSVHELVCIFHEGPPREEPWARSPCSRSPRLLLSQRTKLYKAWVEMKMHTVGDGSQKFRGWGQKPIKSKLNRCDHEPKVEATTSVWHATARSSSVEENRLLYLRSCIRTVGSYYIVSSGGLQRPY